ncbi:unnamed protein product [Diamesa tonsa]
MEAVLIELFNNFNHDYFQNKLDDVKLELSTRMKTGAGIFYPRSEKRGNRAVIRLNKPLLALRTRKDLIDSLLHEMIHAYLSEIGIEEQHGPNFKAKMKEINSLAETNITIKHNYMTWWRCTGTCQLKQEKFFGYIFQLCTETPGPNDSWWREHNLKCCGIYVVSKEPDRNTLRIIKKTHLDQKKMILKESQTSKGVCKISPDKRNNFHF